MAKPTLSCRAFGLELLVVFTFPAINTMTLSEAYQAHIGPERNDAQTRAEPTDTQFPIEKVAT
jgi:hypothetical protein